MNTKTTATTDTDVILAALADLLGQNIALRDAFLADQTPAMREQYWGDVTDARARLGV